jgi:hypothetical protein
MRLKLSRPSIATHCWARPRAIDVDKSGYGSYFKLNGITLSRGIDFFTIYRMVDQKNHVDEFFKCTS